MRESRSPFQNQIMKRIVDHPYFFIFEFMSIGIALLLGISYPGHSWQALIIAIAPLLLRIIAGRSPFVPTPFDLPIVVFLLMAGVGIWAAYQPAIAWLKFWLLLCSVLFFYLLSRQPIDNLWAVSIGLSLLGFGISIYFFLSNNWQVQPQKFAFITQLGTAWMRVRPNLILASIHPNDIAGIAVIVLPFSLALTLRFWKKHSHFCSITFGLISSLISATILLSASRGAWLAVVATTIVYALWWVITHWLHKRTKLAHRTLYMVAAGILIFLALGYIWISMHQRLRQVAIGTADDFVSDSRFHMFWSAIELIKDVPFTGGGLDGFHGLYSSYIMINPNYIVGYSHNIFLDASLQQGILGGLMLLWIYLGILIKLASKPLLRTHSYLRLAVLSSLLIIIIHGLVDNIVLRSLFTVFIFFVPGMAVGLVASTYPEPQKIRVDKPKTLRLSLPVLIALALAIVCLILFRRPIISAWYTDLGAVEMAKVQLTDFPTGTWDDGKKANLLTPAKEQFQRALLYDPNNPHAHYRLGLIAMQERDFTNATKNLELAIQGDPYHRGIIKSLGLSYLWSGNVVTAQPLLSLLPESRQEVEVYSWWWDEQNRPDLAVYAEQYVKMVESGK